MDVKLENLIERIRKEGVEGARQNADEIMKKAQKDADEMRSKARKEAEKIKSDAQAEAERFQKNSELALQQAGRDSVLQLKSTLKEMFDRVFRHEVGQALDPEFMKTLILKIVDVWGKGTEADITVSEGDLKKLEKMLFQGVSKELKEGITLRPAKELTGGFHVGIKNENVFYDFSDETLASLLKSFLNPKINEILDKSNG